MDTANLEYSKETQMETSNSDSNQLKSFSIKGSKLLGDVLASSNFFEKDLSTSDEFVIIKIRFERATLREASSFKEFLENSISEYGKSLIIDLNECEFIDSSFFGVLVGGVKRLKPMGLKFYLVYDNQNRLPIFTVTGLEKIFSVFNSIQEAIKH